MKKRVFCLLLAVLLLLCACREDAPQEESSGFLFWLSFSFYIINFVAITIDASLYFRNKKLDKEREAQG